MKYKFNKNTQFKKSRDEVIIEHCRGKRVLHIGATDAPYTEEKYQNKLLLHAKIVDVAEELLGIDIDKKSIEFLSGKGIKNIVEFNMNKIQELRFEPDVIIFGETIEHIMNQEISLSNLKRIMNKDTRLIVSTPNALWINKIIETFFFNETQHGDHKLIFSYATLKNLFEANNLTFEKVYFTFLNRKREGISKFFKKEFCRIFKGFSETILVVAKLM